MRPSIGRIVVYRSRTGAWSVPAIVAATQETLNVDLVKAGYCPDLDSPEHVHLVVFSPGRPMTPQEQTVLHANFVNPPVDEAWTDVNMGGTFREWNIPIDVGSEEQAPGTWRWPERVS